MTQKYSAYYASLIESLQQQQVGAAFIAQTVSEVYPDAFQITGDAQQFLLINDSQASKFIYEFCRGYLQEVFIYSSEDCTGKVLHCREKLEESLSKAFKILMSAFWSHCSSLQ